MIITFKDSFEKVIAKAEQSYVPRIGEVIVIYDIKKKKQILQVRNVIYNYENITGYDILSNSADHISVYV